MDRGRIGSLLAGGRDLLVPPRCAVCRGPSSAAEPICRRCLTELRSGRPVTVPLGGLGRVRAAVAYEGAARSAVAALKFGRLLAVAAPLAELIAERALPEGEEAPAIVPVPPAPLRARARGVDPAEEVAAELARLLATPLLRPLRRRDRRRQRGRGRSERIAAPPLIELVAPPPPRLLLVDDVVTTGATLGACMRALRAGPRIRVDAVAFAATPPPAPGRRRGLRRA